MARRWVVSAAAVLVVAAACTSGATGGSDGASGSSDERLDPVGATVDVSEPGFHLLPSPPIVERSNYWMGQVRVWTGDELVVWGGRSAGGASDPGEVLGDGATFSPEEGRWRPMSASPFSPGLYNPMGAWDGYEVIIIGTECDTLIPPVTDGSPPECPKGPAAAAYDPADGTWRRLDAPPIPFDEDFDEAVLSPRGAVGGEGGALFASDWSARVVAWDRPSESWASLDAPTSGPYGMEVCADPVEGQFIAVARQQTGVAAVSAAQVLPVGGATWSDPVALGVPIDDDFTCSDNLMTYGEFSLFIEKGSSAALIDVAEGTSTPAFPPTEPGDWRQPYLIGPWLFTTTASALAGMASDPFGNDNEVRLIDDPDSWEALDAPDGFGDGYRDALYLDGVGVISGSVGDGADEQLILWRPPEALRP